MRSIAAHLVLQAEVDQFRHGALARRSAVRLGLRSSKRASVAQILRVLVPQNCRPSVVGSRRCPARLGCAHAPRHPLSCSSRLIPSASQNALAQQPHLDVRESDRAARRPARSLSGRYCCSSSESECEYGRMTCPCTSAGPWPRAAMRHRLRSCASHSRPAGPCRQFPQSGSSGIREQPRDVPARRVHFHRHGDGVPVVLHHTPAAAASGWRRC